MHAAPRAVITAAGLLACALGWVAGSALQLQQPQLWSPAVYLAWMAGGLGTVGVFGLRRTTSLPRLVGLAGAVAALAFALTGLRAGAALAEALPAGLEGRDLSVVGVVASLPQRTAEAWRFRFEVESATLDDVAVAIPSTLALGWYAERGAGKGWLPALRAGQRWQLPLRLKRPHGSQNPWGYDAELQWFEQGVRATGHVRTARGADPRLIDERAGHPVARARQAVRDAIERRVGGGSEAGVLAALVVGDQSAIAGLGQKSRSLTLCT